MALTRLPKNAFATGSVDASKIEDGTIQAVEISGTLPQDKIATGTIANAKLSNTSITINGTSVALGGTFNLGTAIVADVNWQSVITADGSTATTGVVGNGYFIDTTSNAHTFNLPASASIGDTIAIKDYAGTFNTNNLTIDRNGHNIQGVANNSLITTNRASLVLVYVDSTKGWLYAEESNVAFLGPIYMTATGGTITTSGDFKIHTFTGDGCFAVSSLANDVVGPPGNNVDYLVIAGGGGGGSYQSGVDFGRGGGAGGYRESSGNSGPYTASPLASPTGITVTATTYPITVGGGGAGRGSPGAPGTNGSNSVFSTITSTGGGGGGSHTTAGQSGGSGGGGSPTPGNGNTPPTSPPQGFPGSNQGGGAGGPGKNGTTSSINGTPTTRAGGGGGVDGPGGTGGGGTYTVPRSEIDGTANTGGGGGGGGASGAPGVQGGGAGGSGIVIIRYQFQ
jgi:hypothetical protein